MKFYHWYVFYNVNYQKVEEGFSKHMHILEICMFLFFYPYFFLDNFIIIINLDILQFIQCV